MCISYSVQSIVGNIYKSCTYLYFYVTDISLIYVSKIINKSIFKSENNISIAIEILPYYV